MRTKVLFLLLIIALGGCLGGGAKHFRKGQKAHQAGNLEEAKSAYTDALKAEPGHTEYKQALDKVNAELSAEHEAQAREREKSGDWEGASAAWNKAVEAAPGNEDYKVRRALSGAKAKKLGPDEWYEAVKKAKDKHPDNRIAKRSYAGARAAAYQYHVQLGEDLLSSGDGAGAYKHYERAKEIDPSTPGLRRDHVDRAEALSIADQAAARLAASDPVGAYTLYQEAYEKMPLPQIKAKMAQVKAQASAILNKLERARDRASKGRRAESLRLYESLLGMSGVPTSVEAEAQKVRDELINQHCDKAKNQVEKKNMRAAHRSLVAALGFALVGRSEKNTIRKGLDKIRAGDVGEGMKRLEEAGLDAASPIFQAARAFGLGGAKKIFERAKAIAKRDSKRSLQLLTELAPFEEEMPEVKALRRELIVGSFKTMLDEALRLAKRGEAEEAGSLLLAALKSSKAPDKMRVPGEAGCEQLKKGAYADAEKSFQEALNAAARSRLAQRGIDIARLLRRKAEDAAVKVLETGTGDVAKAVETLEAALSLEPGSKTAAAGARVLVEQVKNSGSTLSDKELTKLIKYANRLSSDTSARDAINKGADHLSNADPSSAEGAFAEAVKAAPTSALAKAGQELAKKKMLQALSAGTKVITDEKGAKKLAELFARDPNNAQAKAALRGLLNKALTYANEKRDKEAARLLGFAIIATSPAPGVKMALEKGNKALSGGKMQEAEKAYADALDLEEQNELAKTGHEIAKNARLGVLSSAVASAKSGGNVDKVAEALKRTLEMDPNSKEARKAFEELLGAAKTQGEQGNDKAAAQLLEAANVVSKPETARKAISNANKQLEEGKHKEAEFAYGKLLERAESKVASTGQAIAKNRRVAVIVATMGELKEGGDLLRGGQAAAELREIDPAHAELKTAIDRAFLVAQGSAAGGDDKTAARALRAAAVALGEGKQLEEAIALLESGKHEDAEKAFEKVTTSDLARRAASLSRQRKMGTLTAGLSGKGAEAALSIKALLDADPNNKEARKAFKSLLDKAIEAGRKGEDQAASEAIVHAGIASGAAEDLSSSINVGATHLSSGRYASAERTFIDALELASGSEVTKTAVKVSKASRQRKEKEAEKALKSGDPREHAKVLAASLLVEPKSRIVSKALANLLGRAKRTAKKSEDTETAQLLEAAGLLENVNPDTVKALTDASSLYAKAAFAEAQAAFTALAEDKENGASKVADLGRSLAKTRRIEVLKGELQAAQKEKNVLLQSSVVEKILSVDPNDRTAKREAKKLSKEVVAARLETAETQKGFGKLGIAAVYLKRALTIDPKSKKAKAALAEIEGQLKKRLDLVVVVEAVERDGVPKSSCKGIEDLLRTDVMKVTSRREDLGAYVLSPDWTAAYERKDKDAPEVSGSLVVKVTECKSGSSTGDLVMAWQLLVPRGGSLVSEGKAEGNLPSTIIPRDEQDGKGENAKKHLSERSARVLAEKISEARDVTDTWLMTMAEHALKANDTAAVADAYTRLLLRERASIDPKRAEAIEKYLDEQLK